MQYKIVNLKVIGVPFSRIEERLKNNILYFHQKPQNWTKFVDSEDDPGVNVIKLFSFVADIGV
jgi:hypothetical protein